jgi:hypothetical protein
VQHSQAGEAGREKIQEHGLEGLRIGSHHLRVITLAC